MKTLYLVSYDDAAGCDSDRAHLVPLLLVGNEALANKVNDGLGQYRGDVRPVPSFEPGEEDAARNHYAQMVDQRWREYEQQKREVGAA
jgi:hypothetical protein